MSAISPVVFVSLPHPNADLLVAIAQMRPMEWQTCDTFEWWPDDKNASHSLRLIAAGRGHEVRVAERKGEPLPAQLLADAAIAAITGETK